MMLPTWTESKSRAGALPRAYASDSSQNLTDTDYNLHLILNLKSILKFRNRLVNQICKWKLFDARES